MGCPVITTIDDWSLTGLKHVVLGSTAERTLRTAPCPKKLTEDQCHIYKFSLEDKAYPLIDKAVEAFGKAREKSDELGLYTDYTVQALDKLAELRPEEYPANAELYPEPDFSTDPYLTADFVK